MKPSSPKRVPMILLRLRPAALEKPIHTHTHFHLAPRLHLTAAHSSMHAETLRVERVPQTAAGARMVQREEFVRRIFEQVARRDEGVPPAAGSGSMPSSAQPRQGPLPAVLRRPPARPPQGESAAPGSGATTAPAPFPMPAPPLDLQKLSDQIIHDIDRRLQAHRERMGRR